MADPKKKSKTRPIEQILRIYRKGDAKSLTDQERHRLNVHMAEQGKKGKKEGDSTGTDAAKMRVLTEEEKRKLEGDRERTEEEYRWKEMLRFPTEGWARWLDARGLMPPGVYSDMNQGIFLGHKYADRAQMWNDATNYVRQQLLKAKMMDPSPVPALRQSPWGIGYGAPFGDAALPWEP